MRVYVYPQGDNPDGTNSKDKLFEDVRGRRALNANYIGKSGSVDVYDVPKELVDAFEALAHAHGCTEIYL